MSSAIMAWAFWIAILVACGIGGGAIVGYLFADWRDKHERLNRIKRGESPIMGADIRCYECEGCGVLFVVPEDWDIGAIHNVLELSGWTIEDDEEAVWHFLCDKCSIGHGLNSSNLSKREADAEGSRARPGEASGGGSEHPDTTEKVTS